MNEKDFWLVNFGDNSQYDQVNIFIGAMLAL